MHPTNEIRAAEVDAYLHTQGIVLTPAQRQWFEAYFARTTVDYESVDDDDYLHALD